MLTLLAHTDVSKRASRPRLAALGLLSCLLTVGCGEDPAPRQSNTNINTGDGDGDDDFSGDGDGDDDFSGDGDDDFSGDGDDDFSGDGDDEQTGGGNDLGIDVDAGTIVDNEGGVHKPVDNMGTGSVPPPMDGGKWTLKNGSAPECPEDPPPIPLLGGICVGLYWGCGWENEAKQQYSCVCDWVHYLCVPL